VKSIGFLWRISLGAVGLFDGDDGYLFSQDFERNLFHKETHGFRSAAQCIPDKKADGYWQKYFVRTFPHTTATGASTVVHVVSGLGRYVEPGITRAVHNRPQNQDWLDRHTQSALRKRIEVNESRTRL
jgi:hypothetical protein